jgi:hypothetical protein
MGQKRRLPHRNLAVRFTSINRHTSRVLAVPPSDGAFSFYVAATFFASSKGLGSSLEMVACDTL